MLSAGRKRAVSKEIILLETRNAQRKYSISIGDYPSRRIECSAVSAKSTLHDARRRTSDSDVEVHQRSPTSTRHEIEDLRQQIFALEKQLREGEELDDD
jgi:hypothetical protein